MNKYMNTLMAASAAMLFGLILGLWAVNIVCEDTGKYQRDLFGIQLISISCSPRSIIDD